MNEEGRENSKTKMRTVSSTIKYLPNSARGAEYQSFCPGSVPTGRSAFPGASIIM